MRHIQRLILLTIFLLLILVEGFTQKYWVASSIAIWSDPANWSNSSGGISGAGVPTSSDNAIFDSNGQGNCNLDIPVNIAGINTQLGYLGVINHSNQILVLGSNGFLISGGSFAGGSVNIEINGSLVIIAGTSFTSTSGTLTLSTDVRLFIQIRENKI